jgi:hypothetical protein
VAGVLKDVAGVTGDAIFPFSNFWFLLYLLFYVSK